MIFPINHIERLQKSQKSRMYKAMLDQQVRQNNNINQVNRLRSHMRSKTQVFQPLAYSYNRNRQLELLSIKQLPHQSRFLPQLPDRSKYITDHTYEYNPLNEFNNIDKINKSKLLIPNYYKKNSLSNEAFGRYEGLRKNNQEDVQLEKTLQQCDDLLYGINKKFIKINSHLNGSRKNEKSFLQPQNYLYNNKYSLKHFPVTNSEISIDRNEFVSPYKNSKQNDIYPNDILSNRKSYNIYNSEEDVGRNEMMNFNIAKSKSKQILHAPSFYSQQFSNKPFSHSYQKSNQKSKRRYESYQKSSSPTKKSANISRNHDQLTNSYDSTFIKKLDISKSTSQSGGRMIFEGSKQQGRGSKTGLSKRQSQRLSNDAQQRIRDNRIIQRLRRAKVRGNVLCGVIEGFRKQTKTDRPIQRQKQGENPEKFENNKHKK